MVTILKNRMDLLQKGKTLVLQPQSEIWKVREFLIRNQYEIIQEEMFLDMGKTYVAMKAVKSKEKVPSYTKAQYIFGKLLLEHLNPELFRYLQKQKKVYEDLVYKLNQSISEQTKVRKAECEQMLVYIDEALKYYEM